MMSFNSLQLLVMHRRMLKIADPTYFISYVCLKALLLDLGKENKFKYKRM